MKVDNLCKHFEEFWYQRPEYLKIRNDSRTLKAFKEKLNDFGSTEEIDNYIIDLKSRKETARRIAVAFYDFLRKKGMKVKSELDQIRFYDYPFERQLELAKFLHEPHTNEEIMHHLNIGDERTLRNDLKELREGIEVMGTTVQITEERRGRRKYYKSTLHPIFLQLNLTEVYALTVFMPRVMRSKSPNAELIRSIGRRIKAQLSDYALQRLFPNEELPDKPEELRYINDEELARSQKGILMYLMKSGEPCSFFFNGETKRGCVHYDFDLHSYFVICDDGERLEKPEELEFIIDSLDYR